MEIAVTDMGDAGGSPALLAHCFMGHSGSWKRLLGAMTTPLAALAADLPGHGQSPMPAALGEFHGEVARAIIARLEAAGGGPRLLIGHSFGAAALLRVGLERPDLARALVLIEPVFFAVAGADPEFARYVASEAPMRRALAAGEMERAAQLFLAINADPRPWESLPEALRAQMVAQMPMIEATAAGIIGDAGNLCAPGRLEGFAAPVLVVNGAESPIMFRTVPGALAARLPDCETALIEGAGHMVPLSHPQAVARLIDGFLARKFPQA